MAEINKLPVNSSTSIRKEISKTISLTNSQISYTLAEREPTVENKNQHYFATFNIPHKNSNTIFYSGDTMAKNNPELFQLNVDKIVVIPISENNYSEYIDGRSITLKVPQWGDTFKTVVSSFYNDAQRITKIADSPINYFGPDNVAFLFCDDINKPYTGQTENGTKNNSSNTSWNPTNNFRDRPSAVINKQLGNLDYNTDNRIWSDVKLAVTVPQSYPNFNDSLTYGYNYDIPVGFVCLDKGFVVLTHPEIINNIPWVSGSTSYESGTGENVITGSNAASGTTKIVFTGTNITSTLSYDDISIRYLNSIVCVAMPGTFFISKNPTWPLSRNLYEIDNNTTSFDSIFVTQIGLYNALYELIAVAKLDRPVEKTYDGIISFNLEIDI